VEAVRGEFVAVTGPSGSGKSTLLNLLGGLDKPTGGEVWFRGQRLDLLGETVLARIRNEQFGFIFQTPHIISYKTVMENTALAFHYGGRGQHATRWRDVNDLLDYVGLGKLAMRYPATLSGGELQRLVFARALVNHPSVIFADEPTGSLDGENSRRLLELLSDQALHGTTVLMATHDAEAIGYSTRRVDLDKFSYVS
jgi:putative ABC transport system ATP-binding protein